MIQRRLLSEPLFGRDDLLKLWPVRPNVPIRSEMNVERIPLWLTTAQTVTWFVSRDVEWTVRVSPRHEQTKARQLPAAVAEEFSSPNGPLSESARVALAGSPEGWSDLTTWLEISNGGPYPREPFDQVVDAARAGHVLTKIKGGRLLVAEDWLDQKLAEIRPFVFVLDPGLYAVDEQRRPIPAGEAGLGATNSKGQPRVFALDQQLSDWAAMVCVAVNGVGKRISKDTFKGVAWEHFTNKSGLTDQLLNTAWTFARSHAGWPAAGTIAKKFRICDEELQQLLIRADLLRRQGS